MRILYILSASGISGGATKSFLAMADAVAAAGNEIAVMVPDEVGVTPLLRQRGWEVLVAPYVFCSLPTLAFTVRDTVRFLPRLVKGALLNLKARKKAIKFARKFKSDIVHDNTSVTDIGHHVAKAMGIPHVVHVREYGWRDFRLVLPWLKERLSAPNAWLATITADLAEFRGKGLPQDRVKVVYNGIVDKEDISFDSNKEPYFLYGGRIEPNKGIADLIEAYCIYANCKLQADEEEPLRLKIAGGCNLPSFKAKLVKHIEMYEDVQDYVDWLGQVDDMVSLYRHAAATVIPSYNEGFGRVMPEAMAAGSLCVARDSGGLAEQVANGRRVAGTDIAFDFDDVESLAHILGEIDEGYRRGEAFAPGGNYRRMIEDAQRTVGTLYTKEANGAGILDYYSTILATDLHESK